MKIYDVVWDGEMITENRRIYPKNVQSDFEHQIKQEIQAWIRRQPPEKFWTSPMQSAQEFWNERLN
jgi:hypothetical protein